MHALTVLLLLFAAEPGPAPTPAPANAPTPANTPTPAPDGPPPVEVSLNLAPDPAGGAVPDPQAPQHDPGRPLEVTLGEPLILTLTAKAQRDTMLFPPLTPAVGTFEIGTALPGTERVQGDVKETSWRWTILPVRMGVEKVPGIELPYRTATGQEGSVKTELLRVMIRGHLENEQDPALGKAPPPVDVIATNWALIWALSVGGALVFAALATWLVLLALRQRFEALRPAPPPRPAIDVALERLATIDSASDSELDGAQRLAATIDAMREYLSGRYRIDALEMTTPELRAALPGLDLKGVAALEIEGLLNDADLVKFARLLPPETEAREKSPIVRRIVTETWEPPAEETPEIVRRESASVRQRLYAGLVDGLMAGVLGLLLMGFLWVVGAIELGFLALLLVGLLLMMRDVAGRSPGKQLLRLDVVMRDEAQTGPPIGRRVRRNALLLLWPVTAPLEWMVLRQHPLGLRVGDMWADTEVVRAEGRTAGVLAKRMTGGSV